MAAQSPIIFFDLDGTLLDVSDRHYGVYAETVKKFGGQPLTKTEYLELKRQQTQWPDILKRSGLDPAQVDDFLQHFIELIEQPERLQLDKLMDGVLESLQGLVDYDKYLLSLRRHDERVQQQVEQLGLSSYFKKVISGHAETEGYHFKASLMQPYIMDANGVVIGDTEADIKAAKELSLHSIAVLSGMRDEPYLQSLAPDRIVQSVKDIDQSTIESIVQSERNQA